MLRHLFLMAVLSVMMGAPALSVAQTEQTIQTLSGRLSLEIPRAWVMRPFAEEEEIRGLDSETLVMGTSHDVIDAYLARRFFDGTVLFLSAYPYHVFEPSVLGDITAMLADVTVFDPAEIRATNVGSYPAAEFLFEDPDQGFFASEIIFDTGEMTYRTTAYSTRPTEYDLLHEILGSVTAAPPNLADDLYRTIRTEDRRLSFDIPAHWLYWLEGENGISFATSGAAYQDIAYAYQPAQNPEAAFIVQRLLYAALRTDEVANGAADLARIAQRLRDENGGLRKNTPFTTFTHDGIPALDAAWLVQGRGGSVLTRTQLLDTGDAVYLIQAQYAAHLQARVDAVFEQMRYATPPTLLDTSKVGVEIGQTAPDFTLDLVNGGVASLADYRGQIVLVNMWATWCGPCHREAPAMQTYYTQYGGRFEILAVNVGETPREARGFVTQYGLTFPVLLDEQSRVAQLYELNAYPTTYIIGRDGVIIEKIRGSFTEQGLRDLLAIYVGR